LRKDLLFSRLTTFNDKDESCHAWKASFKGIVEDLQVSDAEQIDLLVKWQLSLVAQQACEQVVKTLMSGLALHSLMESTVDHTDTLSCSLPKLQ
jgi:hypothetical protein